MFNNEITKNSNLKAADKKVKKALPKSKHLKNTKINQLVAGGQGAASGTSNSFICSVCATC